MARQRRERESDKTQEANISRQDLPPSYEDTIKNGQAGGFVDPTTGGLPVKTIVKVIQVRRIKQGSKDVTVLLPIDSFLFNGWLKYPINLI